jgi:hypothetical protein
MNKLLHTFLAYPMRSACLAHLAFLKAQQLCIMATYYIYVFWIILRLNISLYSASVIKYVAFIGGGVHFVGGRNWTFYLR